MTQFRGAVPRFEFDTVLMCVHACARTCEIHHDEAALSQTSASAAWLHGLFNNFPLLGAFLRCPTSNSLARYHDNAV